MTVNAIRQAAVKERDIHSLTELAGEVLHPLMQPTIYGPELDDPRFLVPRPVDRRMAEKPDGEAEKLAFSLKTLKQLAGKIAKIDPKHKSALTLEKIAALALSRGEQSGDPAARVGAYQAGLEVISTLPDDLNYYHRTPLPPCYLGEAARHLTQGRENLYFSHSDRDKRLETKNRELMETGFQCVKVLASSINHHTALALLGAGEANRHTLSLLGKVADAHYPEEKADCKLLGKIAQAALPERPLEIFDPESQADYLRNSLTIMANLADKMTSKQRNQAALLGSIAQAALEEQNCTDKTHKPHWYSSTPHELDGWEKIGEYQGALTVLSTLDEQVNTSVLPRAARRLLMEEGSIYHGGISDSAVKKTRRLRDHYYLGGVRALKTLAEKVDCPKGKAILKEAPDPKTALKNLDLLKNAERKHHES